MKTRIAACLLVILGLAQMAGDLLRVPALKGIAAATGASPAPKVFCVASGTDARGNSFSLETYSTRFYLEWADRLSQSGLASMEITPQVYARLRGPYNRRNVYGAAMSYAPVLRFNPHTAGMFDQVTQHAFCGERPLLRELGIDRRRILGPVRVVLEPHRTTGLSDAGLTTEVGCNE